MTVWLALGAWAVPAGPAGGSAPDDWFVTGYVGRFADTGISRDLTRAWLVDYRDAYLVVLGVGRVLHRSSSDAWQIEVEGQAGRYFNEQDHWELNGAFLFRWNRLPWRHLVDSSVAVDEGLSWASEVPPVEVETHAETGSRRLLNFLVVEVTFAPSPASGWRVFLRLHHRSGVYGLFDGVEGAANINSVGIRYGF